MKLSRRIGMKVAAVTVAVWGAAITGAMAMVMGMVAVGLAQGAPTPRSSDSPGDVPTPAHGVPSMTLDPDVASRIQRATFAGGCFWCMQPPFDKKPGVVKTIVGYTGGEVKDPTYAQVTTGSTGHAEAVQVYFDPEKVTYEELLAEFWRNIDPTQVEGQFADKGSQYRTAIFYHDANQRERAEASKKKLEASAKFDRKIVTTIEPAGDFYRAEEYHQDYYRKNEAHYKLYRVGSGREGFLEEIWGK